MERSERQIPVPNSDGESKNGFWSHRQQGSQSQLNEDKSQEKKGVMVEKSLQNLIEDPLGIQNLLKLSEAVEGTHVNHSRGTKRKKTLMPTRKEEAFKRDVEGTIRAANVIREDEEKAELIQRIYPHVFKSEQKEEATIFIKKGFEKKKNKVFPKPGPQDLNVDAVEQNIPMKHSRLEKPSRIWLPGWFSKLIAIVYSMAAHSIYIFVPILYAGTNFSELLDIELEGRVVVYLHLCEGIFAIYFFSRFVKPIFNESTSKYLTHRQVLVRRLK